MAKTVTKKGAGQRRGASTANTASSKGARPSPKAAKPRRSASATSGRIDNSKSAADALIGLLESPLVADILAAGAAAALAAFTASRASRRREGGSKQALKNAAKAAATAMRARLSEEIDDILESAKSSRRGAR